MRITDAYLAEQQILHADPRGYGGRGAKWAEKVMMLATELGASSILDYGAGQGSLARALRKDMIRVEDFDPAIPAFAFLPKPAPLVVCTDVLEHVEPDCMDDVIAHLAELARPWLFAVVSLVETAKTLSDGRQAHISLHPRAWWEELLSRRFELFRLFDDVKPEKQFVALWRLRK